MDVHPGAKPSPRSEQIPESLSSVWGPPTLPVLLPAILNDLAQFFLARVEIWNNYSRYVLEDQRPRRPRPSPLPNTERSEVMWTALLIAHDELQTGLKGLERLTDPQGTAVSNRVSLLQVEAALAAGIAILGRDADQILSNCNGLAGLARTKAELTTLIDAIPPAQE